MRISVIGCGYLGAVHAACMADLGHDVVGVEVDDARRTALSAGRPPFHEPGFESLLSGAMSTGRLHFTDSIAEAADARVHFICVGTPQRPDGYAADLTYVESAFEALLPHLRADAEGRPAVVVGKSTVPVGTAEGLAARMGAAVGDGATLLWNPEFLREGFAIQDTISPDRIVYGLPEGAAAEAGRDALDEVYADLLSRGIPRLTTDFATAQLVKVAANSFLATKISFINAMAELCEAAGGDVTRLAEAIGYDDRIGHKFLRAGLGFGGGCLPKDIRAFMARAEELGVHEALAFLREVDSVNLRRRTHVVTLARAACDGTVAGRKVAVLGAAFKPNSDDIRDSPALAVATMLRAEGADVTVTDPASIPAVRRAHPDVHVVTDVYEALRDAELVVLATEWPEYVTLNPSSAGRAVTRRSIIDARNALEPSEWRAAGWTYRGVGRP